MNAGSGSISAGVNSRRIYFLLALIAFGIVLWRAITIPLVHDEARTFFMYIQLEDVLPFHAQWDAANHLLVSFVTLPLYQLFGPAPLVLRAFSVVCFALYAAYTWRAGRWVEDPVVRWVMLLAMLFMPFAFDLFSLFRGYGPGLAFLLVALVHGVAFVQHRKQQDLGLLLLAMAAATYANLSLIVVWCAVLGGVLLLLLRMERNEQVRTLLALLLLGVGPLYYLATYAFGLSERGQLYYGTDQGLISGSLVSLNRLVLGNAELWLAWSTVLLASVAVAIAAREVWRKRAAAWMNPLVAVTALLVAEMAGRFVMFQAMGVKYPLDRAAIHWVLFTVLVIALATDRLARAHRSWSWCACVLLFLPLRTVVATSMQTTMLWPEHSMDADLVKTVVDRGVGRPRALLVGAAPFMLQAITYQAKLHHWEIAPPMELDAPGPQDLFFALTGTPIPGFQPIGTSASGRIQLFERTERPDEELVLDSTFTPTGEGFMSLWNGAADHFGTTALIFDVDADFSGFHEPLSGSLVVEVKDSAGGHVYYNGMDLVLWSDPQHFRASCPVPSPSHQAKQLNLYFWDMNGIGLRVDRCRLRIWSQDLTKQN